MKAAPFAYVRPDSLDHALSLLENHGPECKLIAGGMSLVPMMAMRIARPSILVDINRLPELKARDQTDDFIRVGATTRQCEAENDPDLRERVPLMAKALRWVGHLQTRNRGTVGGSLVHADPSAELPLAALVLGANMEIAGHRLGRRRLPAPEFFVDIMTTAVAETECLTAVEWPVWHGPRIGTAFEELSTRHGDFAMASAAVQLQLDSAGQCTRAAFGVGGVASTPLDFPDLARQMIGYRIDEGVAREVSELAAARTAPSTDVHADARYRRHLCSVLLERAILSAASAAASQS